jgi:hypothetical protein
VTKTPGAGRRSLGFTRDLAQPPGGTVQYNDQRGEVD